MLNDKCRTEAQPNYMERSGINVSIVHQILEITIKNELPYFTKPRTFQIKTQLQAAVTNTSLFAILEFSRRQYSKF